MRIRRRPNEFKFVAFMLILFRTVIPTFKCIAVFFLVHIFHPWVLLYLFERIRWAKLTRLSLWFKRLFFIVLMRRWCYLAVTFMLHLIVEILSFYLFKIRFQGLCLSRYWDFIDVFAITPDLYIGVFTIFKGFLVLLERLIRFSLRV